jgi:hypothetical protein
MGARDEGQFGPFGREDTLFRVRLHTVGYPLLGALQNSSGYISTLAVAPRMEAPAEVRLLRA